MDFPQVIAHHTSRGALCRINDTTFAITSTLHGVSATIRVLRGRATVELSSETAGLPAVPSAPVLRDQLERFGGSFYASSIQLHGFLGEMQ